MATITALREADPDAFFTVPQYVATENDLRRWRSCESIARSVAETFEPEGGSDAERFVIFAARQLYHSDMATGGAEDEARGGDVGAALAKLADAVEPDAGATEEAWWDYIGELLDAMDIAVGGPDALEGELGVEEALPYQEGLHPRDRLGRWQRKLAALREYVAKNSHLLRARTADVAAGAAMKAEVKRARRPGGPLRGNPADRVMPSNRELWERAKKEGRTFAAVKREAESRYVNATAAEQRSRQGLRGARQQAERVKARAGGEAIGALSTAVVALDEPSKKVPKDVGKGYAKARSDVSATTDVLDDIDRAKVTGQTTKEMARFIATHDAEMRDLAQVAGRIAKLKVLHQSADGGVERGVDLSEDMYVFACAFAGVDGEDA